MEDFCVVLAGVTAGIRCRFKENRVFFREYEVNGDPAFTVEATEDELFRMRKRTEGSESFLENSVIHWLLAERLVEYNVLLMHGSALCMDGQGILFTGLSGAGKSTHARLWREAFGDRVWMVNDDKPFLRIWENGDGVDIYGSPWDGKHHLSRNASAPLKAIVFIHQDEENHIETISKAEAFPGLMKQCYISDSPVIMTRIAEIEKRILDTVGFYKLNCNTKLEAARVAWKGIREIR